MRSEREVSMEIQRAKELFVIMSGCTKLPYVECHEETYDDEVFVFLHAEYATTEAERLKKDGVNVQVVKLEQKQALGFFSSLYSIGVNCVRMDKGSKEELPIPLEKIVLRTEADKLPEGKVRFENPAFHLTALYFLQKVRTGKPVEKTQEIDELHEEMMIHFWEGKVILAMQEDQKAVMLLKNQKGNTYQPIFTDNEEFKKFCAFNQGAKFNMVVINAKDLPKVIAKDAEGVIVNPFGINLPLPIEREEAVTQ